MLIVDYRALSLSSTRTVFTLRLLIFNWEAPAGPLESLCLEEYITGVPVQASLQAANQQAGGAYRWRHLGKTIFVFLINNVNPQVYTAYSSSFIYIYFLL